MVLVAPRLLEWINVGRWDKFRHPVSGDAGQPAVVVYGPVMTPAQQYPVAQLRCAAV